MRRDRCSSGQTTTYRIWRLSLWAAVLGVVFEGLTGCSAPVAREVDVIATIEEEVLRLREYEAFIALNAADESPLADAVHSRLFDMFIEEKLLDRLARSRGIVDPKPTAIDALLELESRAGIDEGEIQAYYQAHLSDFERPAQAEVRQILVESRAAGERALAALAAGEDFAEVASRLSVGPNAHRGGDQGILARGDLPVSFADVVFELAVGEVSEIVSADYGHHIFQVLEHFEPRLIPLEEVAKEIDRRLFQERADERVDEYMAEAKGRYNVEVFAHNLPFEYQGRFADENDQ